jgi:hypothetical protein
LNHPAHLFESSGAPLCIFLRTGRSATPHPALKTGVSKINFRSSENFAPEFRKFHVGVPKIQR